MYIFLASGYSTVFLASRYSISFMVQHQIPGTASASRYCIGFTALGQIQASSMAFEHTTDGPACSERDPPSWWTASQMNRHGAQHTPVAWPPFTFSRLLRPSFDLISMWKCPAQGCCNRCWEIGLPGELVWAQHAVILPPPPDPHLMAHGRHLSTHVWVITCQVHPYHAGDRWTAWWLGTCPLQLLTFLRYLWSYLYA